MGEGSGGLLYGSGAKILGNNRSLGCVLGGMEPFCSHDVSRGRGALPAVCQHHGAAVGAPRPNYGGLWGSPLPAARPLLAGGCPGVAAGSAPTSAIMSCEKRSPHSARPVPRIKPH